VIEDQNTEETKKKDKAEDAETESPENTKTK
jgi:hypothetical protein